MQKAIPSLYPSWLFSWAMRVLPHKKYRSGHFEWELASTNCRTAGHQLPQDATNGFDEFHATAIRIIVLPRAFKTAQQLFCSS